MKTSQQYCIHIEQTEYIRTYIHIHITAYVCSSTSTYVHVYVLHNVYHMYVHIVKMFVFAIWLHL